MQQVGLVGRVPHRGVHAPPRQARRGRHGLWLHKVAGGAASLRHQAAPLSETVPEPRVLAAHALDCHKAVRQGLAVLAVSGHLVLEGAVQDLLHPGKLLRSAGHQLVPHRPIFAARVLPIGRRLQWRPPQWLDVAGRHEHPPAARLVAENQLHLSRRDTVKVLVVARAMLEGSVQVVAVAHDQVPLAQVVNHEVAKPHCPLANVALSIHVAAIPAVFVVAARLLAELGGRIHHVTVPHIPPADAIAVHVMRDEAVEVTMNSVGVLPANFDVAVPGRGPVAVGHRAELDHQQGGFGLLRGGPGELHLLLPDDVVGRVAWVGRHAPAVAEQERPPVLRQEFRELDGALAQVVGQPLAREEAVGGRVLQVAEVLRAFPHVLCVLLAAPLLHHEVDQLWL
mmetsp:Transcript_75974/g.181769  ORF Transcript_75974/g.181769 Transcript_75974/m.181769 type:complete len:396 (-) Transcript_75974:1038-2225(-)